MSSLVSTMAQPGPPQARQSVHKALARGSCPGIAKPMLTGDGLLARLTVCAPIPLDAFGAICAGSQQHGNGIIEVTQRGSLQIRGLTNNSAPAFAQLVASLGLGQERGPAIITSPLLGLDVHEPHDLRGLVADLQRVLADSAYPASLAPKVSVLIDGGGPINLSDVPADIRLRATPTRLLHLALGGSERTATHLGWVKPQAAVGVIDELLARIANAGVTARASDFDERGELADLRASLFPRLIDDAPPSHQPSSESLGIHELKDGQVAQGIALAFGFTSASTLQRLAWAAADKGATALRPAPGRALLVIGLSRSAAEQMTAVAAREGFIVETKDPRRYVTACAGAPACASAALPTREFAPMLAQAAEQMLDGSVTVHLSGCAKGCAHGLPAALTIVGPNRVILQGRAGDAPQGAISPQDLLRGIGCLNAALLRERQVGESSAALLSRMDTAQVLQLMGARKWHD